MRSISSHLGWVTLILTAVFASLVHAAYDGYISTFNTHGYHMGRTQFPQTLGNMLRDGQGPWIGTRSYPHAQVTPIAERDYPLSDDAVVQAMREAQHTRKFIVLGQPFPVHDATRGIRPTQGFAAAFPVESRWDSANHKVYAFVSVNRAANGPRVHVNGFASVTNAPGLEQDVLNHHFPRLGMVEPGSTLTFGELVHSVYWVP